MTREEILVINSGRELDSLISEHVFKFPITYFGDGNVTELDRLGVGYLIPNYSTVPNYSTDIAAAWEVMDKFDYKYLWRWDKVNGYAMPQGMKWECKLTSKGGSRTYMSYGRTAPHAICLAALLAVMEVEK